MPSFDVVFKVEWAEVKNALNQAQREIEQRFDFKGTAASIEQIESGVVVRANAEDRAKAALDVFEQKLIRRKVSLRHLDKGKPLPGPSSNFKIDVKIKEGIEPEKARKIVKLVKELKLKVQASIQEDMVRVTGKKRDELQQAISMLKKEADDLELELSFINFRD
jgi:uncharacterized protein YajQ (UPF0234 family)